MEENLNRPATLADLNELERRLKTELKAELEANSNALRDALIEKMRDMQTELLRGFATIATSQEIRFRKLEADTSNINHSTTQRLALLEQQMFEVRVKLALDPPPPAAPAA